MLFGERLRKLREDSGMTKWELAKKVGISDRALWYYEVDERFPRKDEVIEKLAKILNVPVEYLLGTSNELMEKNQDKQNILNYTQLTNIKAQLLNTMDHDTEITYKSVV